MSDCRDYGNVCEFGYGKDENGNPEDPISCGYGLCPVCVCDLMYAPICHDGEDYDNDCMYHYI